jgi:hypothetical protein
MPGSIKTAAPAAIAIPASTSRTSSDLTSERVTQVPAVAVISVSMAIRCSET